MHTLQLTVDSNHTLETLFHQFGKSLKHLIFGSTGVTDDVLRLVATQCLLLETLKLIHGVSASEDGIGSLLTACLFLKSVEIYGVVITIAKLKLIVAK